MTNTISLAAGGDKGGLNLSLGNLESKGIVPNNRFNRRTINLGFSYDLTDKFSFMGNINYSNEYNKNPPNVGQQDNTIPVVILIVGKIERAFIGVIHIIRYANAFAFASCFCGNHNHPILSPGTV